MLVVGAGITKGYYNSHGIDAGPKILDYALQFSPLIIQTALGIGNGLIDGVSDEDNQSYTSFGIKGGIQGFGLGALEMGIGYCLGYTFGELSK